MSELVDRLREEFQDEEYRYGYVESFLNTYVAAQLRTLREQRKLTQGQLAGAIGTKQGAVSRLENVNYSAWSVSTLKKLARALGVRLKISFEEFSTLPREVSNFNQPSLQRNEFENDPLFNRVQMLHETGVYEAHGDVINVSKISASDPGEFYRPAQPLKASVVTTELAWSNMLYTTSTAVGKTAVGEYVQ